MDKNILKTSHFIAALAERTSKFNSKEFLKKPLQEMLEVFKKDSFILESSDDEFSSNRKARIPQLLIFQRSKRKYSKSPKMGSNRKSKILVLNLIVSTSKQEKHAEDEFNLNINTKK